MPLTYYDAEHPDGIARDRLPSPAVEHDADCDWWAHTNAEGTIDADDALVFIRAPLEIDVRRVR
jgi:hypothetical protein